MRWRSRGAWTSARTVAAKRSVASPSTWSTVSTPVPRRAKGRGRPGARAASVASGRSPRGPARDVPGAEEVTALARDEPPEEVPVAAAVGLRVPAKHAPERGPQPEHAAVCGREAVDQRGRLAETPAVERAAAERRKERPEVGLAAARVVVLVLAPPEEQERIPPLEMVIVAGERAPAVAGPAVEARGEAVLVDAAVEGGEAPRGPGRLAERALLEHERPGGADGLVARPLVHGVRAGDDPVGPRVEARSVAGGEEGEAHAHVVPAVARDEARAAQVEGPEHVARVLAPGDVLVSPKGPDAQAAAVRAADGRHAARLAGDRPGRAPPAPARSPGSRGGRDKRGARPRACPRSGPRDRTRTERACSGSSRRRAAAWARRRGRCSGN